MDSTNELQALIAEYKALRSPTAKQRGLMEFRMLRLSPRKKGRKGDARILYLADKLGLTGYEIQRRCDVARLGPQADKLWERIDRGMPVGTAARIGKEAKRRAGEYNPNGLAEEIDKALAVHDHVPYEPPVSEMQPPPPPQRHSVDPGASFWAHIKETTMVYVRERLSHVNAHDQQRLMSDFEGDLKSLFEHHQARWYRVASGKKISKADLRNALRTLHMDPPRRGKSVDLKKARSQQRTLARLYHPDSPSGGDHTKSQYQAVIEAFAVIEQWVRENEGGSAKSKNEPPSLRVVEGGKETVGDHHGT